MKHSCPFCLNDEVPGLKERKSENEFKGHSLEKYYGSEGIPLPIEG